VADADEVLREDVQQEAPDELVDGEFEDLPTVAVGGVAVAEDDAMLIGAQDSPVRERNAMGVAAEIAQHALGPREGRLGIDDPVLPSKRVEDGGDADLAAEVLRIAADWAREAA
jgi:hypothetical protein